MEDVQIPSYYVLSRQVPLERINTVLDVLAITPCQAAIVSDVLDVELAASLVSEVLTASDDNAALALAKQWAEQTGRPLLVIGKADLLDAVMTDGTKTAVIEHA